MTPRGGYRGHKLEKKSRKQPTVKVTVYEKTRDMLKEMSSRLGLPIVEIIYRILHHKDFARIEEDIKNNIVDNWHEQDIEPSSSDKDS